MENKNENTDAEEMFKFCMRPSFFLLLGGAIITEIFIYKMPEKMWLGLISTAIFFNLRLKKCTD